MSGEVVEVNEPLADDPGLVNREPTAGGWFIKVRMADPGEVEALLDETAYDNFVSTL